MDDADCAYVMDILNDEKDTRTVELENIKSRGMVARRATYQYSIAEEQAYLDLLDSVASVGEAQADSLRKAVQQQGDPEHALIDAIAAAITDGVTSKTKIVERAASGTGQSERQAARVLEKHTGSDCTLHRWKFERGPRGVQIYELHPSLGDDAENDSDFDDDEDIYDDELHN